MSVELAKADREEQISVYLKQVRAGRTFQHVAALFDVTKQAWSQWEKQGRGPETDQLIEWAISTHGSALSDVCTVALHCLNLRYPELKITVLFKDAPLPVNGNGQHKEPVA